MNHTTNMHKTISYSVVWDAFLWSMANYNMVFKYQNFHIEDEVCQDMKDRQGNAGKCALGSVLLPS